MDAHRRFFQPFPAISSLIQTINGIVTGMILALVASGLTLIFGIMDVVNFAHGELFMLGAYVGVIVLATTGSFWLALIARHADRRAARRARMQIVTLRPLIGRDPLTTILATFGMSLILQNYALWQFGPVARKIQEPFTGHFTSVLSGISLVPAADRGLSAAIIGGFWLFLKYGTLRHLDPRHHAGPRHGAGDGHPGAVGATPACSPSAPAWRRRAACCSARWSASTTPWGSTGC